MDPHLKRIASDPERAGIFLDFDGTLSEIVPTPSDARPLAGVPDLLADLERRFAVVAVVSGRSAGDLLQWLGPSVEIWGLHGAQRVVDGRVALSERAQPFSDLMQQVRSEAQRLVDSLVLDGVIVEDKGVMVGLHYRTASDRDAARAALDELAAELAAGYGLDRAETRLAFELRPPAEFTKAKVVLDRSREASLRKAMFVGDDLVDLAGFQALDTLEDEGIDGLRVAVLSDEAPPALLERADVIVDGPEGVLALLNQLR